MDYDTLKTEFEKLKRDFTSIKIELQETYKSLEEVESKYYDQNTENEKLEEQYDTLVKEHESLKKEHAALKLEYSENIIIESMKDMKERYERLLQTTIPQHRYEILHEKYMKTFKYFTTCIVLLEHINKSVVEFDKYVYTSETKQHLSRISNEINITKSILEDSTKTLQ